MLGEIALVGGEEFRQGCETMDRAIMGASGQTPARVVIIPTAAITGPTKAANDGVAYFANLGGNSSPLMILDANQADDERLIKDLDKNDVIYFTGGSPTHLLAAIKESRLLKGILEAVSRGTVLAGSSAGAMVLGSLMRLPPTEDWGEALGVVQGIGVLPHHEKRDPAKVSRQLENQVPLSLTVFGIDARTGCLGRPGSWRVVGSGNVTVYRNATWTIYHPGENLPSTI